ncbi:MAG: hypothetical protein ACKO1F_09195 [Flammeovirgaceae bacterium]
MVKQELKKGVRKDSLLFNVRFGDSKDAFFGRCFDLNRQHLVTEGPGNSSVQYIFKDSAFHSKPASVRLLFMPNYDENDKIIEMNMEFAYVAWAPWNTEYQSDKLQEFVLKLLKKWYGGNDFIVAKVEGNEVPVKVDGNRRIMVFIRNEQHVLVKIQDILHAKFKHTF